MINIFVGEIQDSGLRILGNIVFNGKSFVVDKFIDFEFRDNEDSDIQEVMEQIDKHGYLLLTGENLL